MKTKSIIIIYQSALMKKLFKKLRKTYNKNPIAYLSLATIAISLFVGTSISSFSQTPQVLTVDLGGDDSESCEAQGQRSCVGPCMWVKEPIIKCLHNSQKPCPKFFCKFTPAKAIPCSERTKPDCYNPCNWESKRTDKCLKYEYRTCTKDDCDNYEKGCNKTVSGICWIGGDIARIKTERNCTGQGGQWEAIQAVCSGKYKTGSCIEYETIDSCAGYFNLTQSKCERRLDLKISPGRCIDRPNIPDPLNDPKISNDSQCFPTEIDRLESSLGFDCEPPEKCVKSSDPEKENHYVCVPDPEFVWPPVNLRSECSPGNTSGNQCEEGKDCVAITIQTASDYAGETYKCLAPEPNKEPCFLQGAYYQHGLPLSAGCDTSTGYYEHKICSNGDWIDDKNFEPTPCDPNPEYNPSPIPEPIPEPNRETSTCLPNPSEEEKELGLECPEGQVCLSLIDTPNTYSCFTTRGSLDEPKTSFLDELFSIFF